MALVFDEKKYLIFLLEPLMPQSFLSEIANQAELFKSRQWQLGHGRKIELGPRSVLMGILNATPDSFSDGGEIFDVNSALERAANLIKDGAQILDIGGESTRPGAEEVSAKQEQDRVLGIIEAISKNFDVLISIDTYKSETARLAVSAGAHIINDVTGLTGDEHLVEVAAQTKSGLCIMHTSRRNDLQGDLIADQFFFLKPAIKKALDAGLDVSHLVLDPGFGFGKDANDNFELLGRLEALLELGLPLLTGTSRKRFTAVKLAEDHTKNDRDIVTSATSVIARMAGSTIFRVHDVATNKKALDMVDSIIAHNYQKTDT